MSGSGVLIRNRQNKLVSHRKKSQEYLWFLEDVIPD